MVRPAHPDPPPPWRPFPAAHRASLSTAARAAALVACLALTLVPAGPLGALPAAVGEPPQAEESAAESPPDGAQPPAKSAEEETAEGEATATGAERPPPPLPERLDRFEPLVERDLTLVVAADAPSEIFIDGLPMGEASPDEPLEITIRSTDRKLRAVSTEVPAADWEKVLEVPAEGDRMRVAVKMQRAIRGTRRKESQTAVVRWIEEGLMWMRQDGGRDLDWEAAGEYCGDLGLAGYDDWRLPTLEELRSMEAIWSRMPFKILGGIVLTGCCPWSADIEGENRAWNFDFRFRREFASNRDLRLGHRALCVRTMSAEEIETVEERARKAKRKKKKGDDEDDPVEAEPPQEPPLL